METGRGNYKKLRKILITSLIALSILLCVELAYLNFYNRRVHLAEGPNASGPVSMKIAGREDGTSTWQKRDYILDGRKVTLNAQTIEGTIINNSPYSLDKWQLRLNINEYCFFNNAWCGTVEIHQNVEKAERVQTLDLRNYDLDKVRLQYYYDGDLLIPLYKGDYVIYYPSEEFHELSVKGNNSLTMGFIMYYFVFPDLSDFEVTYNFARHFYEGYQFYMVIFLSIVWLLTLIVFIASYMTYKKAEKIMEIKKSGILSMSEIYSLIYIIDLVDNELVPVVADEQFEEKRQRNLSPSEQIDRMFREDCEDAYKNLASDMINLGAIRNRLATGNTFAYEYMSKTHGWRRVRLFPMKEGESDVIGKIIYTMQDINDEKALFEDVQNRIDKAENENKEKSIFLANMSHEIRTPINTVIGFDTMILRESKDPVIRSYAKNINSAANMLLSLINGILDVSKMEAEKMELVCAEYSFKKMISEVITMMKARAEFEKLDLICEVSPDIADGLYGDAVRLKQIIINLITNAAKYTDKGSVKVSVFGKPHDGMMHLLVSVKDTGIGIREEDLGKLTERFQRLEEKRNHKIEGTGIGLNLVTGILDMMDSELHVISKYGEGSEFYFELEQKIVDDRKVGVLDFTDASDDEEVYQALFTAPEAEVLVVDDNAMNLKVFVDLLKETELKIDTASSGAKALEMTAAKKYDLIFMDHMMPEMDGIETFRRIRKNKKGANLETDVIILTANALKGAREEYEKEGFNDFLAKPIQPERLEEMVLKHLDPSKVKKGGTRKKEAEVSVPSIAGVDVAYGLAHTGGVANYMALLNQFAAVSATDLEELNGYVEEINKDKANKEALGAYRIKVHSMKSSANILGALTVYGVAATLEELASKEDAEGILSIMPYFAQAWICLGENVRENLPKNESKRELPDKDTLEQLLHQLETSINAYDIKSSDNIVNKLGEFNWAGEKEKLIQQLGNAVANLDAEKVISICGELRL